MPVVSEQPDLTKVPNFEALQAWITKLKEWSTTLHAEHASTKEAFTELTERAEQMTRRIDELEDKAVEYACLIELIEDAQRGIRTWDEVLDDSGLRIVNGSPTIGERNERRPEAEAVRESLGTGPSW